MTNIFRNNNYTKSGYVFAGWNGYSAGMTVKENAEFKVKYNKNIFF